MKYLDLSLTFREVLLSNEKFVSLRTNEERIAFILKEVKPLKVLRKQVFADADKYCGEHKKSLTKSRHFRNKGLNLFKQNKYDLALINFKNAILSAPFPSEEDPCVELSLAYSSRADAYYHMKDYEKALFDAKISMKLLPTVEMFFVKIRCFEFLKKYKEFCESIEDMIEIMNKNEIDLKGMTIEKLENMKKEVEQKLQNDTLIKNETTEEEKTLNFWIHPNCELRSTPRKGRHFIAKEFIPKGKYIIVEKPYEVVLFDDNYLKYCSNCYKKIEDQVWPCRGCNELVFCNENCAEEVWREVHGLECGFVRIIFELRSSLVQVFRMFIKIGPLNAYNLEQLVARNGFNINEYLNDEKQQTMDQKSKTTNEKMTEYKAITTLMHHNQECDNSKNVMHCLLAIQTVILLDYAKVLHFDILSDLDTFVKFADLVVTNQRRILTNVFGWFVYPEDEKLSRIHVANCQCFIASLMNHSCDPNTYWEFIDRNITFRTTRDIKAGEEINDTYGPSRYTPFRERQQLLRNNYSFTCNCIACLEDAQQEPTLQCFQCEGPVIYKSNIKCLLCGEDYKDIESAIEKLECHRILFNRLKNNIIKNIDTEISSVMTETVINVIIQLSYQKSYQLLADLREFVHIFVKSLYRYSDVIKYYKYLRPSIEEMNHKRTTTEQLDDLLLWTNIYYMNLKEGQTNDEEWKTGIGLYNRLIQLLKDVKRNIRDGEDIDEHHINYLKNLIAIKKEELNYLNTYRF